jgi:hypothetical protein
MGLKVRVALLLVTSVTAFIFATYALFTWVEAFDFPKFDNKKMPAVALTAIEQVEHLYISKPVYQYIEIVDSCGPYFEGKCVNARSGPGENYHARAQLRNGVILKIAGKVTGEGRDWYKIVFDEWLRYPERAKGNWYVAADFVRPFTDEGDHLLTSENGNPSSEKYIIVDKSDQALYAYDGDELFMQQIISTGIELTPTPRGTFTIFKKTPSRYMQGPLPGISSKYYDLPGVPWNLYFTQQGAVIHGAYWHDKFGRKWSNGCVNVDPKQAEKLYKWTDIGTKVIVRD